jgi:hypothetical protein
MTDEKLVELAGDHITWHEDADGKLTIQFGDRPPGARGCGSCQLCCKLLPVPDLQKPAGTKCRHARVGKGCTIYADRPFPCRVWACRWLADATATAGMPRPDRCHYVIDTAPDYITANAPDGTSRRISVIQVWVDPAFRDAWRTPELRAFMLRQAQQFSLATIIRWSSRDALMVFPPPFDADGEWHEMTGDVVHRTAEEEAILTDYEVQVE